MNTLNPIEQDEKMSSLKDSFQHVTTRDILDVFQAKGWNVSSVNVLNPRKPEHQGYQRHLVRLENPAFPSIPGLSAANSSIPQICLLNANNATTALRLFFGFLRTACLNGIISGASLADFKAVHSKNVLTRLGEGIEFLSANMHTMFSQVQALQSVQFTESMVKEYTKAMFDARLSSVGKVINVNYNLPLQRVEDSALDGFTVHQRVQEYLIRGGIHYTCLRDVKDSQGNVMATRTIHTHTRKLASIQGQIKLNRIAYDEVIRIAGIEVKAV